MTDYAANWRRHWGYTAPFCDALETAFGVRFYTENTGGGCICLVAATCFENGWNVTIGSGVDGPLWTHDEREDYRAEHGRHDGFGLTVIDGEGHALSTVRDLLAQTPDQLVELVKRGLSLAPIHTPTQMRRWERDADGVVTEGWSAR